MNLKTDIQSLDAYREGISRNTDELQASFQQTNLFQPQQQDETMRSSSSSRSSECFSMHILTKKQEVGISGSLRLCKLIFGIIFGTFCLLLINIYVDNQCLESYREYQCTLQEQHPRCQQWADCYQTHDNYYFSLQENILLIMFYSVFMLCYYSNDKGLPSYCLKTNRKRQ